MVLGSEIPDKGRVLTGLSAFWFSRTRDLVPNHLLAIGADGRSLECRRLEMLPVEIVVRGYLAGSGWKDYAARRYRVRSCATGGSRRVRAQLPEPIVTPATKATTGHDLNITEAEAAELCGAGSVDRGPHAALRVYAFAAAHASAAGIIVADTKFELGLDTDGVVTLGDEAVTPDSSRLWPADGYSPAESQPSFDKQFVRDWCERSGWDKTAPGPELDAETSSPAPAPATSRRSSG